MSTYFRKAPTIILVAFLGLLSACSSNHGTQASDPSLAGVWVDQNALTNYTTMNQRAFCQEVRTNPDSYAVHSAAGALAKVITISPQGEVLQYSYGHDNDRNKSDLSIGTVSRRGEFRLDENGHGRFQAQSGEPTTWDDGRLGVSPTSDRTLNFVSQDKSLHAVYTRSDASEAAAFENAVVACLPPHFR